MSKRSLWIGGVGAMALCAAAGAYAQDNSSSAVIGPPQLRDFQIQPKQRIVTQPAPTPQPSAPAPGNTASPAARPNPPTAQPRDTRPAVAAPRPQQPARTAPVAAAPVPDAAPAPTIPMPSADASAPASVPAAPVPAATAPARSEGEGISWWLYAGPAAALALLGLVLLRRRRRRTADEAPVLAETMPALAEPAPPPKPRPDPIPRPWLELSLKAERASFTQTEAELQFELEIGNKGGSPARNLRIDVKMFNGGAEQDQEIGAFFRTAGRESTKLNLPAVEAGVTGVIQGRVTMALADMRAMRLDERLLFIPVVAVNALYDWGEGRTGQTSKSYLIGRELQQQSDKMGAFRVDQGPRVWRTIAQRDHKLAKRV